MMHGSQGKQKNYLKFVDISLLKPYTDFFYLALLCKDTKINIETLIIVNLKQLLLYIIILISHQTQHIPLQLVPQKSFIC